MGSYVTEDAHGEYQQDEARIRGVHHQRIVLLGLRSKS